MNGAQQSNPGGRPAFKPNERQQYSVGLMCSIGIPQDQIALSLGIAPKTLRQHFRAELDVGATKMITRVADSLVRQAISGNVSACIFILKCRAGWRDSGEEKVGKKEQARIDAQQPPADSVWAGLLK